MANIKKKEFSISSQIHYFIKNFIERIYIDILLCLINIPRSNAQFFIESTKKIIDKYIFNNERSQKVISKPNQKKIHFISIIKRWSVSIILILRMDNSSIFCSFASNKRRDEQEYTIKEKTRV